MILNKLRVADHGPQSAIARNRKFESISLQRRVVCEPRHLHSMPGGISMAGLTEVLGGLVDRVTFHNTENGFCVLRVKARGQRDLITVVGHAAMVSAGEFIQASGGWVNDRTHGVQFRASFLKATAPTTVEGIEKYLGSGMIRGIGPVYAKKLVRA